MKLLKIFMALFLCFGVVATTYPFVATYINDTTGTRVITDYDRLVENLKKQQAEQQQLFVKDMDKKLSKIDLHEITRKYLEQEKRKENKLDKAKSRTKYNNGEMLGYISIPKINLELPIYEGTAETVLYKGVGRFKDYSLINGETGNHTVLTGHSGYNTATLFDDLDLLEVKDVFYIHYYDEIHKYIIDSINIVKPDKGDSHFRPAENYAYCTLVTCTPKFVNSHRLLVRGIRIPNDDKNGTEADLKGIKERYSQQEYTAIIICTVIITILLIITQKLRKRQAK